MSVSDRGSASRRRSVMETNSLRAREGTLSRTPMKARCSRTSRSMSVSATMLAERGWRSKQRELSEVAAGAEGRHLAFLAAHAGLPVDDEEELPADGALLAEDPAGGDGHLVQRLADVAQVASRAAGKQPDVGEIDLFPVLMDSE